MHNHISLVAVFVKYKLTSKKKMYIFFSICLSLPGWNSPFNYHRTLPLWLFKMKAAEFTILAHHAICPESLKDGIFSNIPEWLKMLSYVTSDYLSQLVLCYIKDVTNVNHM